MPNVNERLSLKFEIFGPSFSHAFNTQLLFRFITYCITLGGNTITVKNNSDRLRLIKSLYGFGGKFVLLQYSKGQN